jgi:hypothetical protein
MATSVEAAELDKIVATISEQAAVRQAFWSPSTSE